MKLSSLCIAAVLSVSTTCVLHAELIDQIPAGPFTTHTFAGGTAAYSQFDTGASGGQVANFFTVWDNLNFTSAGVIDSVSWVGGYDMTPPAPATFKVAFYSNTGGAPGAGGQPGTLLTEYSVGTANPTPATGNFISYSTTATPFAVAPGTDYWMSVVSQLNWNDAGWGLAFSSMGDGTAFREFGETLPLTRQAIGTDFAIRVNAVPEPSGLLCLIGVVGATAFRRRRSA